MRARRILSGRSSALFRRKEIKYGKSYETFVTDLRKLLLAAMDLKEEEIYFSNDGEKIWLFGR